VGALPGARRLAPRAGSQPFATALEESKGYAARRTAKDETPGFCVPLHRSLTEPMLVAGVPPQIAIGLGSVTAILVLAWHFYALVPVLLIAYVAAVAVCRRDPYAFDIIFQNLGPNRYAPLLRQCLALHGNRKQLRPPAVSSASRDARQRPRGRRSNAPPCIALQRRRATLIFLFQR
jgi:type IV secretion system protein VirB3